MKYERTPPFKREFKKFPVDVRRALKKQITFLLRDIRHPSLRAKKYGGVANVWQARVTDNVRFYFQITSDTYLLLNIRKHPK
jgi:mRNA interferase RelE/StbE